MKNNETEKTEQQIAEEQIIKQTQELAKKVGHCLCNLKLACPCEDFIEKGLCPCSDYKINAMRKKREN